jgi:outer membrane protein
VKNQSIIINVLLIIAVAVLYFLHFNQKPDTEEKSTEVAEMPDFQVAYINSDSVLAKYDYAEKLKEDFRVKTEGMEKDYQNRVQGLQREITDYQQNAGNLTINQAKALEENLMQKQQNLQLYQQKLQQDLLTEEATINKDLYERVTGFLRDYGRENNLQLIVKYDQGSDVLFASDAMDITQFVIDGLNQSYSEEQLNPADSTASE